jgi:diketogulonate reductase-like aldo/keto reductase
MTSADEIAFGTGGLRSPDVFREAWRAGYRVFDTAVYYANDAELFAALDACGAGEEARVVHKVQPYRVSAQFERLIRPKLGGRPLDTLLLHHPALFVLDARPAALMRPWSELERLVERGLVRRIGCSNAGPSFIEYLFAHARVKPAVNQVECHPWQYDAELMRCCRERGVEVQGYSPLGSGRVPVLESTTIQEIARATRRSAAQVCLRWSIQKGLVPIVRTRSAEHMRDNRQALGFSLDVAQMEAIDRISQSGRAWDDPVKRGCLSATVSPTRIRVPNRVRFGIRSALHYGAVELLLRRRAGGRHGRSPRPDASVEGRDR